MNAYKSGIHKKIEENESYQQGVDFDEVDEDHQLVKTSFRFPNQESENSARGGQNKRHFIISGECFKLLCAQSQTSAGDRARRYFVKIEEAVQLFISYINYVRFQRETQKKNEILAIAENDKLKAESDKLKAENDKLKAEAEAAQLKAQIEKEAHERAETLRQLEFERAENERLRRETQRADVNRIYNTIKARAQPNGWIYIAANKESFKQTMFKIGKADDLNHRLATYHTGHQGDDRMQYLAFWHVNNADIYERICLWILQSWRVVAETPGARANRESNSEIICMPFVNLKNVMNLAICVSVDAAFNEIYNFLDDPDILIDSGLTHREAIKDANLPTYLPICTVEHLAAEREQQRLAAIPKFETQVQRDAAAAKAAMLKIAESYVNFAFAPTPQCSSATTLSKKHIVPVVKLREWIIKNEKAFLPSTEEFKSYVINLCADHHQLTVVLKKPNKWKSVNDN